MKTQDNKIFRDNVHGYIEIPVEYVTSFIDTELFQRLRNIEQTSMRTLYPSARHDRFIHSLGTYYLGDKAFDSFRKNVKATYGNAENNHYYIYNNEKDSELFWDKHKILFDIACLLHDCGHSPFSHTLEFHYDKEPISGGDSLHDLLKRYNGSEEFKKDYSGQGAPHEKMSALLVSTHFKERIDSIIKNHKLDKIDDESDSIEFIVRCIIGCTYKNTDINRNQIKNCLIELLNSKSIDVDSLDYIVRDSKLSGVDNMNIDIERLIGSLTLVEITKCYGSELHGEEVSANIVEGKIEAIGTSKAEINGKVNGEICEKGSIIGELSGYVNLNGHFRTNKEVSVYPDENGVIVSANALDFGNNQLPKQGGIASIALRGIIEESLEYDGTDLSLAKDSNAKIKSSFNNLELKSVFFNGKISGKFTGVVLGNHSNLKESSVECKLGFHKSSLSVIQNVIVARNYEYQWIYSHHKVAYYSNYLIVDLLKRCINYILTMNGVIDKRADDVLAEVFSWQHMIDENAQKNIYNLFGMSLYRITDSDVQAIFKKCYLDLLSSNTKDDLFVLLEEYYSRNYRLSLWKSYAEFNTFLRDFTKSEKDKIFKKIQENSSFNFMGQYGYLSDEWANAFRKFGLIDVVWVTGDCKLKNLDPDSTYILFKDGPLSYRSISTNNDIRPIVTFNLFYIYYRPMKGSINKSGLIDFLKRKLKD
ncbi:MAG: HD domain-containing protein [Ruminococcus sp.]|nr:HD domain-containing protein [Ruminococcus sp.]